MSRESDNLSNSLGASELGIEDEEEEEKKCYQIYGMHFCGKCDNLMQFNKDNG